jgi:hypothetical protein
MPPARWDVFPQRAGGAFSPVVFVSLPFKLSFFALSFWKL